MKITLSKKGKTIFEATIIAFEDLAFPSYERTILIWGLSNLRKKAINISIGKKECTTLISSFLIILFSIKTLLKRFFLSGKSMILMFLCFSHSSIYCELFWLYGVEMYTLYFVCSNVDFTLATVPPTVPIFGSRYNIEGLIFIFLKSFLWDTSQTATSAKCYLMKRCVLCVSSLE